ncbi:hypothetical protein TDSAC_1200 [Thermodesulfobium acidiphilum]|uniref:Uncharacterized protein n=1 Tax=Thermodesulfobium acidiphilum TaxID=1794699 RepID=A0A2R4W151_THEAF|nr:hypothetical protein [Thermodesulfobium acidiphilum]AWB10543.1 hypothetical protein TDSAC_1200 [Thermodesulfobium acidiphilum]PMP84908.1 MAG: hypothetical protein C0174_06025 [Thermodesulfobium narugense]
MIIISFLILVAILVISFFAILEIRFRRLPETSVQLNFDSTKVDFFSDEKYFYLPFSIDNVSEIIAIVHDVSCILLEPKTRVLDIVSVGYPVENYFKTSLVHPKSGIPILVLLPKEHLKEGKLQFHIKYSGRRDMSMYFSKFHYNFSDNFLKGAIVYEKSYTN